MDIFLNRLEICYYNALMAKNIDIKARVLNRLPIILMYSKYITDLFYLLHKRNAKLFDDMPYLVLLTYDTVAIGEAIKIPVSSQLTYEDHTFKIDYIINFDDYDSDSSNWC